MKAIRYTVILMPFIIFVSSFIYYYDTVPYDQREDRDAKILVKEKGYPTQYYEIYTPSGYQLSLLRIQSKSQKNITNQTGEPILFLHGFSCDYNIFLGNYEDYSIPFVLANKGYDIWLANFRGTSNSNKHKNLTIEDKEYWDYDMTAYSEEDLPILIEFVGEQTNSKVNLFTSSLGGTHTLWALGKQNPKVEKYINKAILSGVGVFSAMAELVEPFNYFHIEKVIKSIGLPYIPYTSLGKIAAKHYPPIIKLIVKYVTEGDADYNYDRIQYLMTAFPQNCPTKLVEHLIQIQRAKKFQSFDYGKEQNLIKYGSETPELWQGENIRKGDIHFLHGEQDAMFPPKSLEFFIEQAPQANIQVHLLKKQGHCSFLMSNDKNIINTILQILEN